MVVLPQIADVDDPTLVIVRLLHGAAERGGDVLLVVVDRLADVPRLVVPHPGIPRATHRVVAQLQLPSEGDVSRVLHVFRGGLLVGVGVLPLVMEEALIHCRQGLFLADATFLESVQRLVTTHLRRLDQIKAPHVVQDHASGQRRTLLHTSHLGSHHARVLLQSEGGFVSSGAGVVPVEDVDVLSAIRRTAVRRPNHQRTFAIVAVDLIKCGVPERLEPRLSLVLVGGLVTVGHQQEVALGGASFPDETIANHRHGRVGDRLREDPPDAGLLLEPQHQVDHPFTDVRVLA